MNRRKIGIDFDCVLSDTTEKIIKLYNYYTDENVKFNDLIKWDFNQIDKIKYKNLLIDLFNNDKLWESIEPIKNSIYYLKRLNEEFDIYIVTSTYCENVKIKVKWLLNNYPFLKEEQIIIIRNKQLLNIDCLVDDYEMNLINGDYHKIMLDYPWNQNVNCQKHGIIRVNTWDEIYYTIMRLFINDYRKEY